MTGKRNTKLTVLRSSLVRAWRILIEVKVFKLVHSVLDALDESYVRLR